MAAWAILGAATLPWAGCVEKMPVEKPPAPDMSDLLKSYEAPSLTLDATNIGDVAKVQTSVADTIQRLLDLYPTVGTSVKSGVESDGETEQPLQTQDTQRETLKVDGEGFLTVHRICPGWDTSLGALETNGNIDLTVGFTERGFDPVVWGELHDCRVTLLQQPVTVRGTVRLHVGQDVAFDAFGSKPLVLALQGELVLGGVTGKLVADVRILPTGGFEYLVHSGDRHVVYWDTVQARGFRAANGNFTCQFEQHQCTDESGNSLTW